MKRGNAGWPFIGLRCRKQSSFDAFRYPKNVRRRFAERHEDVVVIRKEAALAGQQQLPRIDRARHSIDLYRLLFEVGATDPLTFAAVSAVMLGVALLACFLPALRAAGMDPARTLREE